MNRPNAVETAVECWPEPVPDWIIVLAEEVNRSSQARVASTIRYSAPVISAVLRNNYAGKSANIELAVRGAYMDGKVACPELGEIPSHECVEHMRSSKTFKNTNPLRIRMYRACRKCPRNFEGEN